MWCWCRLNTFHWFGMKGAVRPHPGVYGGPNGVAPLYLPRFFPRACAGIQAPISAGTTAMSTDDHHL